MPAESLEEELQVLDRKLAQLKRDYDQYFLGARPREPNLLRSEVNKAVIRLTNTVIQNTAQRFKFSGICSRFQAFRRQWDDTLRKIEEGTYQRHQFKAKMHGQPGGAGNAAASRTRDDRKPGDDIYRSYVDARLACGESVQGLTRDKLERVLDRQREQLRQRFGDDADFSFRVAVEDGKVRLKASRRKD